MRKLFLSLLVIMLSMTAFGQSIVGPTSACVGTNTTLSGIPSGGTWSCTAPGTISPLGVITSTTTGVSSVTYSTGSGSAVITFAFNPNPTTTFATNLPLCNSITMTATPSGGTWSSANPAVVAINPTTGSATAMSAAGTTTNITYTLPTGCYATTIVSVDPTNTVVSGIQRICTGYTSLFTATGATGGTWSSSNVAIATVSSSGIVTGISSGTTTISYTPSCGISFTKVVTVTTTGAAGPITGPSSVCVGSTSTLSSTPTGGTWSSSTTSVATIFSGGTVYGVAPGTSTITYTYAACPSGSSTSVVTVGAAPSCPGTPMICAGSTLTMTCAGSGSTWSTSSVNASVTSGGVVTGISPGTAILTFTTSGGCTGKDTVSVLTAPSAITGSTSVCVGGTSTLSCFPSGGMWGSSNPTVATISSGGVVTGLAVGTTTITFGLTTGCSTSVIVTVGTASGSVSASATPVTCGSGYVLTATGGGAYTWSPSAGLSCSTCPSITVNPSSTTTYVVTGSIGGCTGSANVTVGGANRIYGHINFTMGMPSTPSCLVWLVQYDPSDSSITALDSVITCMDGSTPFYMFNGVAAGNYFVKAKLLSSVAGTSGYVPTYGASTPNWYGATNISHGSVSDVQNITMVYGTVPSGPGFISGYVYAGAGKGTSGDAPVAGMLIYLRNSTGTILTYTYTDASGAYNFPGINYGNYVIYPEEYNYYTTPSSIITLNAANANASNVSFRQNTSVGTITPLPIVTNGVNILPLTNDIAIYPNPASGNVSVQWSNQNAGNADVEMTDVLGRNVYHSRISMMSSTGEVMLDVNNLVAGVYSITIKTNSNIHTGKLLIQK